MCHTSRRRAIAGLLLLSTQQLEVFDELREGHVEAVRQFEHDAQRGVDLAALDRPDVVAMKAGSPAENVLRQLSTRAQEAGGATEVAEVRATFKDGRT
jgi:hypothetical protein